MNSNYSEFKFPQIKAHPWKGVFRARTPPEVGYELASNQCRSLHEVAVFLALTCTFVT